MAGYACEMCGGEEQGAILITPLNGADTMSIGEKCMPVALTGMLAGTLGIDGDKLYAAAERLQKAAQGAQDGQGGGGGGQGGIPKRQPGASGRRPARTSRQAARTAAAAQLHDGGGQDGADGGGQS